MNNSNLLGVWKLVSYITTDLSTRNVYYPFGHNALGYLIYTSEYVSVHIMRSKCTGYLSNPSASFENKIETVENYAGYIGLYRIEENSIIHIPLLCGYEHYLNTSQKREAQLTDNHLILSHPIYDSKLQIIGVDTLSWEKE